MKDYHTKPSNKVRSVEDALKDAERLRNELPRIVQVFARDWDKVILADRIAELEETVERMKCCGNCKNHYIPDLAVPCKSMFDFSCCDNWASDCLTKEKRYAETTIKKKLEENKR